MKIIVSIIKGNLPLIAGKKSCILKSMPQTKKASVVEAKALEIIHRNRVN